MESLHSLLVSMVPRSVSQPRVFKHQQQYYLCHNSSPILTPEILVKHLTWNKESTHVTTVIIMVRESQQFSSCTQLNVLHVSYDTCDTGTSVHFSHPSESSQPRSRSLRASHSGPNVLRDGVDGQFDLQSPTVTLPYFRTKKGLNILRQRTNQSQNPGPLSI